MERSTPTAAAPPENYALHDDLAKLCLPQEYRDQYRTLAWVNSICALFLIIGLTGLKPPPFQIRELEPVEELVPVVIQPPPEPPKPEEEKPEEPPPDKPEEIITDEPVVATVVAADASSVAFAVPVKGPVILAPSARFAPPPPANLKAPPTTGEATRYVPSNEDWGGKRLPDYPSLALRRGYQGKVTIEVSFDASGAQLSASVKQSSGYSILDEAALKHVQENLRLSNPPGEPRRHHIDVIFQLR